LKVILNSIKEVHISHLLKTSIENLTKIEAITQEPKLFWCKGILFIPFEYNVDELEIQKTKGVYYLDKFYYAECKERIDQSRYNGFSVEVIDLTGDLVYENLISSLEDKK